jgi:mono/diheme cytochrome c family protein
VSTRRAARGEGDRVAGSSAGAGGHGGGAPLDRQTDVAAVMATVTAGKNAMPPFGTALTADQIRAVASYVVQKLFR